MRAYNMITAFANANIQGTDRLIRAFAEKPAATSLKIAGAVSLPSALLWWANHEDPRYAEIPQWQKDLFWIVMTKDHIYRVPKPFETGIMFGSGVERTLDAYYAHNPKAFDGFFQSVWGALTPTFVPTAVQPMVEQFANRSTFTGNPLVPASVEKLLPEYQYNPYTTETTKKLATVIAAFPGMRDASLEANNPFGPVARALTTPVLIDNYVRAWTGGLGVYTQQIVDAGLRKAGVVPDPVLPAATLADIPVIRAFVARYPSASAQSIQEFYDRFAEKKRVFDTFMAKAQEGDLEAAQKVQRFDPSAMAQLSGYPEALTSMQQVIQGVYKNPDIPPDEKRQIIDTMYFRMIEVAKAGNQALDQAEARLNPSVVK